MSSRKSSQVVLVKRQSSAPTDTTTTFTTNDTGSGTPTSTPFTGTDTTSTIIATDSQVGPPTPTPSATTSTYPSDSASTPAQTSSTTPTQTSSTTPTQTGSTTPTQSSTQSPVATVSSTSTNAGTIAGCVVGGVLFLVLVALVAVLYLRARKRRRTPPSAEFMNSHRAGTTRVLRFDSGAEYTPTPPEKGGGHTHYPPTVPLPFLQNSYYTSPPMQDMKFPDELMMTAIPFRRPSAENTQQPLRPQRYSSQANDAFVAQHNPSTSVGSRKELWGSETDIVSNESSPVRLTPLRGDSVLQFAPRFSLDEPSHSLHLSHSPTSLQPLRRQPE